MPTDIPALNAKHQIPGIAQIIPAAGGLPAVQVTAPSAAGTIYLHGAHVTSWKPQNADEVLWLSTKSHWQNDKPIRGGVPICFPWFGMRKDHPKSPQHGFARLKEWQLESIAQQADDVTVTLKTQSDDTTRQLWPHEFILRHKVTFGQQLVMALAFTNTGNSPVQFEEAQHTYFAVGDVRTIHIAGLAGARYLDKTDHMQEKQIQSDIAITAETDRACFDTSAPITLDDPSKSRRITITKEGSRSTVVWNPWIEKARAMADFGDDEWPQMVCIETCNVGPDGVTVAPGQTHIMSTYLNVTPRPRSAPERPTR